MSLSIKILNRCATAWAQCLRATESPQKQTGFYNIINFSTNLLVFSGEVLYIRQACSQQSIAVGLSTKIVDHSATTWAQCLRATEGPQKQTGFYNIIKFSANLSVFSGEVLYLRQACSQQGIPHGSFHKNSGPCCDGLGPDLRFTGSPRKPTGFHINRVGF